MGKLPWFKFFPSDWQTDTELGRCSKAAKGVWIDMLAAMFRAPIRGVFCEANGAAWPDEEVARLIGGDTAENLGCIHELLSKGVASRNNRGAIFSRRMVADEGERSGWRDRKAKSRVHGDVTELSHTMSHDSLTSDSKPTTTYLEREDLKPPANSDELIEEIAHLHPVNWRERGKLLIIPPVDCEAIAKAIMRDGLDAVLQGTRDCAKAYEARPPGDRQFIGTVSKWYETQQYLHGASYWEKSNGQPSKARTVAESNLAAIVANRNRGGGSGTAVREATDTAGDSGLGDNPSKASARGS